jgi:o-succinylbenzoate synthase
VVRLLAARARLVRLEFARPLRTARGEFGARESVLFELRDEDGVRGFGEAASWPGFGTESVQHSFALLLDAESLLLGLEVEPGDWPRALDSHLAVAPAARTALQGALWDLAARRAGRPLAAELAARLDPRQLVGCGEVLREVPVSMLLTSDEPAALRAAAARARDSGHRAVKIKLGAATLADDVARARAAREGLGPALRLRGDANGAWTLPAARAALEALAPFDFDYVEQPLAADDFDGFAELHRNAPLRIAADESVATEAGALRLLEVGAVDVVVLKPATLGGAARALELAARARRAGIEVVFSHTFETAVGARHALHCAAAWGDPAALHGLCTEGLFADDVAAPVGCRGGVAEVGETPGIGITL